MKRRVVAVVGGTRGIGRVVAELFASRGTSVAVCARSPRDRSLPKGIFHARLDVRRRRAVKTFIGAVCKRFGSLDVLINCAGISRWRAVEELDEAFVNDVVQTSLLGTLWSCAAAADMMPRGSCIVNVSSLAGKRGSANNSAYCAAKFAVNGITQALAKELGPRGIRVNAVCPVYIETQTVRAALAEPASPANGRGVKAYLGSFAKTQTALGRLPTAKEVAEVIYFLTSEQASALSGQCVNVDCGAFPQ